MKQGLKHMNKGKACMKILKIDGAKAHFYCLITNDWKAIDSITKDDLLRLVNHLVDNEVEMDVYDESLIGNPAHQIIYKSLYEKLVSLNNNKKKFKDESEREYLTEIQKYEKK